MINISKIKNKYFDSLKAQKGCEISCQHDPCQCEALAEMFAYRDAVIPADVRKLGIQDFDGLSPNKEELIPVQIVQEAKWQLMNYCWKLPDGCDKDEETKHDAIRRFNGVPVEKRNARLIMEQRREEGRNVVIFGEGSSRGRSLVASIVMKEAIRRRFLHKDWSYNWVGFNALMSGLREKSEEVLYYQGVDWLVIDNIMLYQGSDDACAYRHGMLDPFLIHRIESSLPTILVFRSDIRDKLQSVERSLGNVMASIVNDKRTFNIALS